MYEEPRSGEIFIAKNYYSQMYNSNLSDKTLFEMMTSNAATAFSLNKQGAIKEGNLADLVIVNSKSKNSYSFVSEMNYEDIMLVVIDGIPRYGDESFIPLFEALDISFQKIKVDKYKKIIHGDILGLLDRIREAVGFEKNLEFLPVEPW